MSFVHLHTHSHYSMMRGTAGLEQLCRAVHDRGMDTVALTDTNGLYGLVFFLQIAEEMGIRPIVGAEVVTEKERAILLVKNQAGYAHLCQILTMRHCEDHFVLSDTLTTLHEGLIILSDTISLLKGLNNRADLYMELVGGRSYQKHLQFAREQKFSLAAHSHGLTPDPHPPW